MRFPMDTQKQCYKNHISLPGARPGPGPAVTHTHTFLWSRLHTCTLWVIRYVVNMWLIHGQCIHVYTNIFTLDLRFLKAPQGIQKLSAPWPIMMIACCMCAHFGATLLFIALVVISNNLGPRNIQIMPEYKHTGCGHSDHFNGHRY